VRSKKRDRTVFLLQGSRLERDRSIFLLEVPSSKRDRFVYLLEVPSSKRDRTVFLLEVPSSKCDRSIFLLNVRSAEFSTGCVRKWLDIPCPDSSRNSHSASPEAQVVETRPDRWSTTRSPDPLPIL